MRPEILSKLELRSAQESADVRLHISGSNGKYIRPERTRRFAGNFVGGDTDRDTGQLLARERRARAHDVVAAAAAGQAGSLELYEGTMTTGPNAGTEEIALRKSAAARCW